VPFSTSVGFSLGGCFLSYLPHCLQNINVAQPSLGWSGSRARLVAVKQAGQYVQAAGRLKSRRKCLGVIVV